MSIRRVISKMLEGPNQEWRHREKLKIDAFPTFSNRVPTWCIGCNIVPRTCDPGMVMPFSVIVNLCKKNGFNGICLPRPNSLLLHFSLSFLSCKRCVVVRQARGYLVYKNRRSIKGTCIDDECKTLIFSIFRTF